MSKRGSGPESDAELWARVARSAKPLRKEKSPSRPEPKGPADSPGDKARPQPKVSRTLPKARPAVRAENLDRQTARRLERGRLPVEARLDLHGMRQSDAHAALRRFLRSAQGKGYRHVLVITGKGADAEEPRSFYAGGDRGVLRQAVPHWLVAPDLADVVISYSEAPRRLGGEGALYVRLRKRRVPQSAANPTK